jgi:glycosyltransferase involved in cell wall biosynthesis
MLLGRGCRVIVIRAPGDADDESATADDHPALEVITVDPVPSLRQRYGSWKRRWQRAPGMDGSAAVSQAPAGWAPPTKIGLLNRFAYALMWLPDDQQGFVAVASRAAIAAVRRRPGAWLYSSAPPASAHLAALRAARATGARWLAEFRDPWTDNPGKPWYTRTAFTDRIERWLERRCLDRADLVVSVSDGIDTVLRNKLPTSAGDKFLVARNGIDGSSQRPEPSDRNRPIRIVHVGTLYLGRDPQPFLQALARVVRRRGLRPADLQVDFIGDAESFDGVSVRAVVDALGLSEYVGFTSWLPHREAQERIREADVLLLLAEGQPLQVPNKVYEYLAARRAVLAFADPEGDTATIMRRSGSHWVVSAREPAKIDAALDELVSTHGQRIHFDEEYLAGLQAEVQLDRVWRAMVAAEARAERGLRRG